RHGIFCPSHLVWAASLWPAGYDDGDSAAGRLVRDTRSAGLINPRRLLERLPFTSSALQQHHVGVEPLLRATDVALALPWQRLLFVLGQVRRLNVGHRIIDASFLSLEEK